MKITTTLTLRMGEPGAYDYISPGVSLNLTNEEAEVLIDRGFAIKDPVGDPRVALIDAIMDAIDDLSPDAFGQDGKPNVKAIQDIIGQNISAADRDEAWVAYQSLTS